MSLKLTSVPWAVLGNGPWPRPPAPPSDSLPEQIQFAVVGAGITGLACALRLAGDGHDVVVIDRAFGEGATCRSGGVIVGDTLVGPAVGFGGCEIELRDWIQERAIPCGLHWTGCAELDRVATEADGGPDGRMSGFPALWRDGGAVRVAGMIAGGVLNPAALLSGLAAEATRAGARFVDHAALVSCTAEAGGVRLETSAGSLACERLVLAIDATGSLDRDDPWPERAITIVLETAPIPDETARAIGWADRWPFYTNDLPLLWGRPMESGGMMAGRELVPLTGDAVDLEAAIARAGEALAQRVRGLHPALAALAVRRIWAGPIARDGAGIPGIRAHADLRHTWVVGGYGGHGLAQAFRLGQQVARYVEDLPSPRHGQPIGR
jgi:glycine/D-amino acid oxidase-like deaminating enzyme